MTADPRSSRRGAGQAPLRIAHVGPVATSIPPTGASSVETMTSLLTEGLVAAGHDVTLFATAESTTNARLHATFAKGYWQDGTLWPWELCEMFNLAAAVERASQFDIIHYEAMYYPMSLAFTRFTGTPVVQTLHHAPSAAEVALWSRYAEAPFIAISDEQARLLQGLNVVATVLHAIDTDRFAFRETPDDYLLFLGRFTEGKGVIQAIEVARRAGMTLLLVAAENDYYREHVAPLVDGVHVVYMGEADHDTKVRLYGGACALLYPVQAREPFGLVLAESMACGTPVAALDAGAVREVVDDGVTGFAFESLDAMVAGLPRVCALDRTAVRGRAVQKFGVARMVDGYVAAYRKVIEGRRGRKAISLPRRGKLRASPSTSRSGRLGASPSTSRSGRLRASGKERKRG
jgi:glycosyltransferase involved in cell wall biosynthesis